MVWLDAVLRQVMPVFVVLSLLLILVPSLRRKGSWRGVGAAWLAVFAIALVVAVTHLNALSLDCSWLNLLRTGVTGVTALNASGPCSGGNSLSPWLVALPPLIGIGILLAWVWRHTRPAVSAMRMVAGLTAIAVVVIALGQVSEPLALLFAAVVAAAAYDWPRLPRQHSGASAAP